MNKPKKIIVHVTDSDDSLDIGFHEINEWHRQRGFKSKSGINCGYHYIIRKNGVVERGRPDEEVGAHTKGKNTGSLGIVWVGRKDLNAKQFRTLQVLIRGLMHQYDIDITDVYGHYEFNKNKTCPNIDMIKFRANLIFVQEG